MKAVKYPVMAIGGWILSVLLIGLGSARADSIDLLETSYEVNIKGITVVDVEYSAGISAKDYHSQASVKTRGIVAFFSDYLMEMESSGSIVDGQARPTQYTSLREKKNKTRKIELNWSDGGVSTKDHQDIQNPDIQAQIDAALTPNVADLLTAILRIGSSHSGGLCQTNQRIFDGKEVFELRFNFTREVTFDENSPGAYHGPAYECQMTYVPVAGRYATKFRDRKEEPPAYKVWFATVGNDKSGGSLSVPIRASGKLDGLKFVAYANRVKVDGRPFNQLTLK